MLSRIELLRYEWSNVFGTCNISITRARGFFLRVCQVN